MSVGGWSIAIIAEGASEADAVFESGGEVKTTNNRMELQAAIEGLSRTPEGSQVWLHSDSAYLINCFNDKWYVKWIHNNWMRGKNPVLNVEHWKKLIDLSSKRKVNWIKVKGHSTDALNNKCDELAVAAIQKMKEVR